MQLLIMVRQEYFLFPHSVTWSLGHSSTVCWHYSDVIMSTMAYQITGVSIVYSIVGSGVDQRKHQSYASLAFERGIHRWPVNSPHKKPVTRKMFSFDDVIMDCIAMYLQAKPIFHHNLRTQIIKKNSKRGHFQAAPCLTKHVFKKKKKKKNWQYASWGVTCIIIWRLRGHMKPGYTFVCSQLHCRLRVDWLTHWPLGDVTVILHSSGTCSEIALMWMPQNSISDESTLVQVWCRQANKSLPGPVWTQIYIAIWASLGHNELNVLLRTSYSKEMTCPGPTLYITMTS